MFSNYIIAQGVIYIFSSFLFISLHLPYIGPISARPISARHISDNSGALPFWLLTPISARHISVRPISARPISARHISDNSGPSILASHTHFGLAHFGPRPFHFGFSHPMCVYINIQIQIYTYTHMSITSSYVDRNMIGVLLCSYYACNARKLAPVSQSPRDPGITCAGR